MHFKGVFTPETPNKSSGFDTFDTGFHTY